MFGMSAPSPWYEMPSQIARTRVYRRDENGQGSRDTMQIQDSLVRFIEAERDQVVLRELHEAGWIDVGVIAASLPPEAAIEPVS